MWQKRGDEHISTHKSPKILSGKFHKSKIFFTKYNIVKTFYFTTYTFTINSSFSTSNISFSIIFFGSCGLGPHGESKRLGHGRFPNYQNKNIFPHKLHHQTKLYIYLFLFVLLQYNTNIHPHLNNISTSS